MVRPGLFGVVVFFLKISFYWDCSRVQGGLIPIIFVDLGGGRAKETPARYFLHIWPASFGYIKDPCS